MMDAKFSRARARSTSPLASACSKAGRFVARPALPLKRSGRVSHQSGPLRISAAHILVSRSGLLLLYLNARQPVATAVATVAEFVLPATAAPDRARDPGNAL